MSVLSLSVSLLLVFSKRIAMRLVLLLLVLLRTHRLATAHWFVYLKKTFPVHPRTGVNLRLHVVELKGWLEGPAATTVGKKQDLVKR